MLFVLDQGGTRRTTSTTSSALPAGAQGPSSSAASGNNDSSVGGSGGDGGGGAAGLTALAYGVQAELDGLMPGLGGRVVQLGMDAYEQELLAAVGGLAGGSVDNSTGGGGGTGLAVASVAGARWGSYAGFPLSPPVTALLAADARPLDDLLQRDDGGELEWTDINLFFREVGRGFAAYGSADGAGRVAGGVLGLKLAILWGGGGCSVVWGAEGGVMHLLSISAPCANVGNIVRIPRRSPAGVVGQHGAHAVVVVVGSYPCA